MRAAVAAVALLLAASSGQARLLRRSQTPITEVVEMGGVAFKGNDIEYNSCSPFKASEMPSIKVCGASTVVKVFLRNRCESYSKYVEKVGLCTGATTGDGCVTVSSDRWLAAAQSYVVEQCGAGQGEAHDFEGPACKTFEECQQYAQEQADKEKEAAMEKNAMASFGVSLGPDGKPSTR